MSAPTTASEPTAATTGDDAGAPSLEAHDLRCRRGGRTLFSDLALRLDPGELVQVEGPNGCGKTTLLRVICGLSPPDAGTVRWSGEDIAEARAAFLGALTWVGHASGIKRDLTPRENLRATAALATAPLVTSVEHALARMGLEAHADTPTRALSAGQGRRVALARLVLQPTLLWVLDEPFAALDAQSKHLLEGLVADHCRAGGMVLLTTHQPADFRDLAVRRLRLGA